MSEFSNGKAMTPEEERALDEQRAAAWEALLAPARAQKELTAMAVRANVVAGNIKPQELIEQKTAFPLFKPGVKLQVGDVVRTTAGDLWKTIQAHTTQADWAPGPATMAMFNKVEITAGTPTAPLAWQAGVAYKVADERTDAGSAYVCLQDHTSQAGWEPHATASLWQKK